MRHGGSVAHPRFFLLAHFGTIGHIPAHFRPPVHTQRVIRWHIGCAFSAPGARPAHAHLHSAPAQRERPLPLPPRCAFVMTKAQRAAARRVNSRASCQEKNRRPKDFGPANRCAFVARKAQRATYERGRPRRVAVVARLTPPCGSAAPGNRRSPVRVPGGSSARRRSRSPAARAPTRSRSAAAPTTRRCAPDRVVAAVRLAHRRRRAHRGAGARRLHHAHLRACGAT